MAAALAPVRLEERPLVAVRGIAHHHPVRAHLFGSHPVIMCHPITLGPSTDMMAPCRTPSECAMPGLMTGAPPTSATWRDSSVSMQGQARLDPRDPMAHRHAANRREHRVPAGHLDFHIGVIL